MTKFRATCFVIGALLTGCSDSPERAAQQDSNETNSLAEPTAEPLECRPDDAAAISLVEFSPSSGDRVPFRCLRFTDSAAVTANSREYRVIDIDGDRAGGSTGVLQIPLHEIKTKGFLRGRKLAVASDGTRFGAIERECEAIKAAGVEQVLALVSAADMPRRISARDFVAERSYGVWQFVNRTSLDELDSPLLTTGNSPTVDLSRDLSKKNHGLVRTLVIFDSSDHESLSALPSVDDNNPVFVLDGGLVGLRQFEAEATAMAKALARPRIGERGCAG